MNKNYPTLNKVSTGKQEFDGSVQNTTADNSITGVSSEGQDASTGDIQVKGQTENCNLDNSISFSKDEIEKTQQNHISLTPSEFKTGALQGFFSHSIIDNSLTVHVHSTKDEITARRLLTVQLQTQLVELEKNKAILLEKTANKKNQPVKNLQELKELVEKLKRNYEDAKDEKWAPIIEKRLNCCQSVEKELPPIDKKIQYLQGEIQKLEEEQQDNNVSTFHAKELRNKKETITRSISEKIDSLRKKVLANRNLQSALELYIPVRASVNRRSIEHFDLEAETHVFLASNKKVMLLLGFAGEGKSTFCLYLYKKLWSEYAPDKSIPVFISLPTMEKPKTQLLQEYFYSQGFTLEEIEWLRTDYSFVFILDGYDEMNSTHNLYVHNKLDDWQAHVVISCRTQYLEQVSQYSIYFKPIRILESTEEDFQEVTTIPFNKEQVDLYITQYLKIHSEVREFGDLTKYHHYFRIFNLQELIVTPFLLMIALKVIPSIVKKHPDITQDNTSEIRITKSKLYDEFMQWWFERGVRKVMLNPSIEIPRHCNLSAEFERISEELAIEMNHAGVMQVRYNTSEELLGLSYGRNFKAYEILSIATAELKKFSLVEDIMFLLYVKDCPKIDERWCIVAKNNAGGLTYNAKTGWLTVSALKHSWFLRTSFIPEHQEQILKKKRALTYADTQLQTYTPETLPQDIRQAVFQAIIMGLTHSWDYFFDIRHAQVERTLPGIPVQPTEQGGYMFLHLEILTHFYNKAIIRSARPDMTNKTQRKPWDIPPVAEALNQHGAFKKPVANHTDNPSIAGQTKDQTPDLTGGNCIIH